MLTKTETIMNPEQLHQELVAVMYSNTNPTKSVREKLKESCVFKYGVQCNIDSVTAIYGEMSSACVEQLYEEEDTVTAGCMPFSEKEFTIYFLGESSARYLERVRVSLRSLIRAHKRNTLYIKLQSIPGMGVKRSRRVQNLIRDYYEGEGVTTW